jgi:2-polyprenyl-6-methoxyphenol hydroxylase-like FAD-dependent oxidoreductase
MARILVVGGGVAGLASALALSQDGHEVRLLERDPTPLPANPVEAFERWERHGAPQVWHSHAFLARLRNLLVERAPEVLAALHAHGAYDLRFADYLPPTLQGRTPEPDDEKLTLFACRRITFEWVLRREVLARPGVSWRCGVEVRGLAAVRDPATGLPRVSGVQVRTADGTETWDADLVVDASGRRSRVGSWLAALGAAPVEEESEDCGIFYCSRFYRLRSGASPPENQGVVGADLGYMKFGIFPGDGGIFSITLAAPVDDDPMRALLREGPFEAAARALPATRDWIDPARAEPVTPVRAMAKLRNRRRRFVATRRELGPWYKAARDQDREAREIAAEQARGDGPATASGPSGIVDPKAFLRSVFRDGLLPALRSDIQVVRAFLRVFNLLAPPDALMTDPEIVGRVLAAWRERDQRPALEPPGPERDAMLEVLARAA